jgi:hypothetical protein
MMSDLRWFGIRQGVEVKYIGQHFSLSSKQNHKHRKLFQSRSNICDQQTLLRRLNNEIMRTYTCMKGINNAYNV